MMQLQIRGGCGRLRHCSNDYRTTALFGIEISAKDFSKTRNLVQVVENYHRRKFRTSTLTLIRQVRQVLSQFLAIFVISTESSDSFGTRVLSTPSDQILPNLSSEIRLSCSTWTTKDYSPVIGEEGDVPLEYGFGYQSFKRESVQTSSRTRSFKANSYFGNISNQIATRKKFRLRSFLGAQNFSNVVAQDGISAQSYVRNWINASQIFLHGTKQQKFC